MPRTKRTEGEKWRIIGMRDAGMKQVDIARALTVSQSVVSRLLKKHRETGSVKDRKRSGRPKATTQREDRLLFRLSRRNRFASCETLRNQLRDTHRIRVSRSLVNSRLLKARLRARRPAKRPRLTVRHKGERLDWARQRQAWRLRNWRKVLWTDESRFCLYHTDGRARVRRLPGERYIDPCVQTTVAGGGGSVMVWGAFSYDHILPLKVVNGTLNSQKYRDEILEPVVRPFLNSPEGQNMVLQDDNARPHRARIIQEYKTQQNIGSLPWPSLSPDLNPIEHLWDELGRRVRNREPAVSSLGELRQALLEEWDRIPRVRRMKLVTSMIKRCQVVIRQRGGYTQY